MNVNYSHHKSWFFFFKLHKIEINMNCYIKSLIFIFLSFFLSVGFAKNNNNKIELYRHLRSVMKIFNKNLELKWNMEPENFRKNLEMFINVLYDVKLSDFKYNYRYERVE